MCKSIIADCCLRDRFSKRRPKRPSKTRKRYRVKRPAVSILPPFLAGPMEKRERKRNERQITMWLDALDSFHDDCRSVKTAGKIGIESGSLELSRSLLDATESTRQPTPPFHQRQRWMIRKLYYFIFSFSPLDGIDTNTDGRLSFRT